MSIASRFPRFRSEVSEALFNSTCRLFGYPPGCWFPTADMAHRIGEHTLPVVPSRWSFGLLRPVETVRGITGRGILVWGFGRVLWLSPKEMAHLV